MSSTLKIAALAGAALTARAQAQCPSPLTPSYPAPSLASGWQATLIATDLESPRSIMFDSEGHLLVVEQNTGISSLSLTRESNGCWSTTKTTVVEGSNLNHGLELSEDGRTLYASSNTGVYSWEYDPVAQSVSGDRRTLITVGGVHHYTRTLLRSRQTPGWMLVSWGSQENVDPTATTVDTGVSQVRAFELAEIGDEPVLFNSSGTLMGWGLRNSVGLGEHPLTGGIFSNENSVDQLERSGTDVHENNPGEELNFHGYLNGTDSPTQGQNYGYPFCFAAWAVDELPQNENIVIGTQFAIGDQNATVNDTYCREDTVPPVLTFAAHMAPMDLAFSADGSACYITFRGSWNRDEPQGYKLAVIPFNNVTGMPSAPADSDASYTDIMTNPDTSRCPDECFRPVGLAWSSEGELFMASDATGEIWLVQREGEQPADGAPIPSPTSTGIGSSPTQGAASGLELKKSSGVLAGLLLLLAFVI